MTDLERLVHDLIARVDALERQNDTIGKQNAALVAEISTLREPGNATVATRKVAPPESLNRRQVLQRGLHVAAASVAAGVVFQQTTPDAAASHSTDLINAGAVVAHYIEGVAEDDHSGVLGRTGSTGAENAGVVGINTATLGQGSGVLGIGETGVRGTGTTVGVYGRGGYGLYGNSTSLSSPAVFGTHYPVNGPPVAGPGVVGFGYGSSAEDAGVIGQNITGGVGVRGEGKTGVHGIASGGTSQGVLGEGGSGYGGQFKETRAQLRLTPTGRIGKPTTGTHQIGEVYLDKLGAIYICMSTGTPGTWRKVNTTAA